ncbi:FecCD family ABC transporter permease [Radicibacter daui]|uniref:FecCD family ABC transporter permease n=1 Tax=Radicibacter daui TaxID=3064829 RepID=UPI004046F93A
MNRLQDVGDGSVALAMAGGRLSVRLSRRGLLASGLMLAASLVFVLLSLTSGDYAITPGDVVRVLAGGGDDMLRLVVLEWRLPRACLAVVLGMALGISGAIFQSLTRNPLGSPDIMGFSVGSYTGVLIVMLVFSGGYAETSVGALVGGIGTAAAIYLLTWRRGVDGFRLVVVGIGVAAMLSAANVWLIRKADLQVAISAAQWAAGSLNGLGREQLAATSFCLLLLLPAVFVLSRPMRQLELGQAVAVASGVLPERTRLFLALVGVALVAVVTATAGPIAFVALAAPQLARRLSRSAGALLLPSALMGGLLLVMADWAAQHALGFQLPVGIMTFNIGGLYFLWLLASDGRK